MTVSSVFDVPPQTAGHPFRFRCAGEDFEWPIVPDARILSSLREHNVAEVLEQLFGQEQHERFLATGTSMPASDFAGLLEAYKQHMITSVHTGRHNRAARRRAKRRN